MDNCPSRDPKWSGQDWSKFVQNASKTSKRVQQTSLAQLAPPNQRSKARYLNVDTLVAWGQNMLCYLDCQVEINLSK
jgi:hypothetical protein